MIARVLAIIVDYQSPADAEKLSLQLSDQLTKKIRADAKNTNQFELKVVHVDNGSLPASMQSDQQKLMGIEFASTGKNLGYAGALNYAVRKYNGMQEHPKCSYYDAFWFLNSDLEINPDCLPQLVKVLDEHPRVGAVGPVVRDYFKPDRVWGARGKVSPLLGTTAMTDWKQGGVLPKWSYIPGCSLLVRATAYDEVGGLPESYKLYFEETEFCIRLQRANWDLWIDLGATAYHKVDSMKDRIPARHFAYYFTRNNLTFWKTCFGIPPWIQFPRTLFVVFKEVLLPLRRARSWAEAWDRLKFMGAGLVDGILMSLQFPLLFESKLFR